MSNNREFLMLAKEVDKVGKELLGHYMSEKLDGMRAFWDGGRSRGKKASEIPWANTDKDSRLVEEVIATGLWSRYGKVIRAPDWFLDKLPNFNLDGELYLGRQRFQDLMSKVKDHNGDWTGVTYQVFNSPLDCQVFREGRINNPNFKKIIKMSPKFEPERCFRAMYEGLENLRCWNDTVQLLNQVPITDTEIIDPLLEKITREGGEGLMFAHPYGVWEPKRSGYLLKYKKLSDAEATVVGYLSGDIGKLEGLVGSLIVDWKGVKFELSGLTEQERTWKQDDAYEWCKRNPKEIVPQDFNARHFPRGSQVTFLYRELTRDGRPREARYWRKRHD